jgi:hypothetical protein
MLKTTGVAAVGGLLPGFIDFVSAQAPLSDPLASVALDGSPAQAFASHKARANGLARHFALTRHLSTVQGEAGEDNTVTLMAHLHAASEDPTFAVPNQEPSLTAAPKALRRLTRGEGKVGTFGKYDFALKGLMPIAYRYRHLLSEEDFNHILNELLPGEISGGHPVEVEFLEVTFLNIDIPETENHLLMTESSRYLINQLRHTRPGDRFDNARNGLSEWLLGYMQRIAKHDFMEFNARPYARLSLHSLYNLHEFAHDIEIRTAAQILLDYTMVKFALSSTRGRRVSPYRRLQPRINHQANRSNYLYDPGGDQVAGCFLACTGMIDAAGKPVHFPASLDYTGLIASTAAYRPPPAAYILAMKDDNPASLHRFYHGTRPRVLRSPDIAEGGLEIYYRSPSFLLSAGGQFLNSGYGNDELGEPIKPAWRDTSRAQATTLIPTRADVGFHELLRFEPYPDRFVDPYGRLHEYDDDEAERRRTFAVNIGVHRGLAAGANMRPAEKKTIDEQTTSTFPALASDGGGLFVAWKGSGNNNINLARVLTATLFEIPGVEGIHQKFVLADTTDRAPALAFMNNRLFLAWKGSGNDNLNLMFTRNGGKDFRGKTTFGETSHHAPAVIAHNGILFLAWTGRGEGNLNIAKVGFTPEMNAVLVDKVVLGDTSKASPALASHNGRLFIAWRGSGNTQLNLAFSEDDGRTFKGKQTFSDSSEQAPALISHEGRLYLAWAGRGNEKLNVAKVVLIGNTAGAFGIEGLEAKVVLNEISTQSPALGSWNKLLFLSWKGEGDDNLNLRVSRDGAFATPNRWTFSDLTHLGFYVAAYRTPPSGAGDLDKPLDNLGFVYAVEKSDMDARGIDFNRFRELTLARNGHLPASLDYGGTYEFHAPDDRNFSIWFKLTGDKYKARVIDLGDRLDDLATLPLVSGEFMRAPGGHDGLIEIRQPGSERTPIVLDYRETRRPHRTDDKTSHPGPWIERALALFAIAPRLEQLARPKDMHAALADAAGLYDEMLRLNTDRHGPLLAPGVILGLATIGVDFSVPQGELLEWLANPEFTPYPAIAQALFLLRRKLKQPVFLDVIAFNYEHAPGVTSPRKIGEVRTRILKKAILEGSNVRYGTNERDFEALLVPG